MTKKQTEMLQFLSKFKSCTEEQLIFFTEGTIQDINYMIKSNYIIKDERTKALYLKLNKLNIRNVVALDVVRLIKDNVKRIENSKRFPVIFNIITKENISCDILVVRSKEQDTVFKKLSDYSRADRIIIVLENSNYNKKLINSDKEILICSYPIKIIDLINSNFFSC